MDKFAIALCRVSTKRQLDDGNLVPQEARIVNAAKQLGIQIEPDAWWRVAVSSRKGKNYKRKDLMEMVRYCKIHKRVKYLIIDEPDRFMRSIEDYYHWKVVFKLVGVKLIRADKPDLNMDDPRNIFDELIDVYKAEQSNQERITKTPEKQMSKMRAGYYTFKPLPGYRLSDVPSLHAVDESRFYLLQRALKAVASRSLTPNEALKRMTAEGYLTVNGNEMDMARFRQIMVKPYYAGIIQVGNWPVASENGLHEHMITKSEHESIKLIALGKQKKFKVDKKNPEFPLNETICVDCMNEELASGKVTGYRNHNGKREKGAGDIHYYYRYRCRGCDTYFTRDELHLLVDKKLNSVELDSDGKMLLIEELQKCWRQQVQTNANKINQLKSKLALIEGEQSKLALSYATADDDIIKRATKSALDKKEEERLQLTHEMSKLSDVDSEMDDFIEYAINYTEELRKNYWGQTWERRKRCEQLLFPDGFYVNRQKKVYTPNLSPIYRYRNKQKEPLKALELSYGGRYANKFAPMLDEIIRWRGLIENNLVISTMIEG